MLRVAFGFNKGDVMSVPNNGNKIIDHCRDIARKLFVEAEDTMWSETDVVKLGNAVKNRINAYVFAYHLLLVSESLLTMLKFKEIVF
jgi:hypothetical protein